MESPAFRHCGALQRLAIFSIQEAYLEGQQCDAKLFRNCPISAANESLRRVPPVTRFSAELEVLWKLSACI
jgi:hypothetical protein